MTFVGRILIVVIVLMSVCVAAFTATAYSVQQNWKESTEKEITLREKLKTERDDIETGLNSQIDTLKSERDTLQTELALSQGDAVRVKQERDSLVDQNEKTQANVDQLQEQNRLLSAENERGKEKIVSLNSQLGDVQKQLDILGEEKRNLQDEVYTLTKQTLDFSKRHILLLAKSGSQQALIQKARLRWGKFEFDRLQNEDIPPPIVEGRVTATKRTDRGKTVLVEISIGKDDGLKIGHKIEVFRNNGKPKFLGTIVLTKVTPDKAVGILDPDTKNGIIEKGDHVTTQL